MFDWDKILNYAVQKCVPLMWCTSKGNWVWSPLGHQEFHREWRAIGTSTRRHLEATPNMTSLIYLQPFVPNSWPFPVAQDKWIVAWERDENQPMVPCNIINWAMWSMFFFLRSSIDLDQLSNHSYTFVPKKYQHSGLRYAWRRTLWQTMNWWGRFSSLSIMRTTVLGRRGSHPLVTFKFLAIAYRHTGPGTCSRIYELMTM